jgi:predicted GNAT superfamily acetyltransferase
MPAAMSRAPQSKAHGIAIRRLGAPEEMLACVGLQKTVWRFSDLELVPLRMFVVASRTGGQVFGAFDGEHAIGFALALTAYREGHMYIHSHMTAVLPEYQNQGVGRQLKLAQRDDALNRGVDLIEWTFDPLQLRNAYFNIVRLGATVREYLPNLYGQTSSPLHHGLPTDRLVAQWWIRGPRVKQILAGHAARQSSGDERVGVPRNILEICEQHPEQAKELQAQIRLNFQRSFSQGHTVSGFELDGNGGRYLLERI